MKILACVQDLHLLNDLMRRIRQNPDMMLYAVSALPTDMDIIDCLNIDVCLFDYEQHKNCAFSCAYYTNHLYHYDVHIVFLLQDSRKDYSDLINKSTQTMSFVAAPYTTDEVLKRLLMLKEITPFRAAIPDYKTCASRIIQEMGIPIHLKGYHFIKSGAIIIYKRGGQLLSMVQLYREIARIHKSTASRVEKAIRDAIEYAYRKTKERISADGCRPTNSQLMYHVYEQMIIEIKKARENKNRRLMK